MKLLYELLHGDLHSPVLLSCIAFYVPPPTTHYNASFAILPARTDILKNSHIQRIMIQYNKIMLTAHWTYFLTTNPPAMKRKYADKIGEDRVSWVSFTMVEVDVWSALFYNNKHSFPPTTNEFAKSSNPLPLL